MQIILLVPDFTYHIIFILIICSEVSKLLKKGDFLRIIYHKTDIKQIKDDLALIGALVQNSIFFQDNQPRLFL